MERHPVSREFMLKLRRVRYKKCQQNLLLSPKSLSFSSICQAQYKHSFRPFVYGYFIRVYMNILYIYIYISIGGRRVVVGG